MASESREMKKTPQLTGETLTQLLSRTDAACYTLIFHVRSIQSIVQNHSMPLQHGKICVRTILSYVHHTRRAVTVSIALHLTI